MNLLISLILFLPMSAGAFSGKWDVQVEKSRHGDFKGLFWSDVDETVGEGPSPVVTAKDLEDAVREEFEDPKAALAQLEQLKGSGGKVYFKFGYEDYTDDYDARVWNGSLEHGCGIDSPHKDRSMFFIQHGSGVVSHGAIEPGRFPRSADDGKFFQFKNASKAQIKRFMAKCLARFPFMPPLKKHAPPNVQYHIPPEVYEDLRSWLSSFPGVGPVGNRKAKFNNAIGCLMGAMTKEVPDWKGNVLVFQKAKADKDSLVNVGTFVSEVDHLPSHIGVEESRGKNKSTYSMAFMDQESLARTKWKKGEIQTQGIWPNYQGGSVASLMGQVFGNQFYVNIKACLLQSGLEFPDINKVLHTVYDPHACEDIDGDSISHNTQLQLHCDNKMGEACLMLALNHHYGKEFTCLPKNVGGQCYYMDSKSDSRKATPLYERACELGVAGGCYAMAAIFDRKSSISLQREYDSAIVYYKKGCKIQKINGCFFWEQGFNYVKEEDLPRYENECNGKFFPRRACHHVALYHRDQGNEARSLEFFQKACEARSNYKTPDPCLDVGQAMVKEGKKKEAIEFLKKKCSYLNNTSCSLLYELSDEKAKQALIKEVCPFDKKVCF